MKYHGCWGSDGVDAFAAKSWWHDHEIYHSTDGVERVWSPIFDWIKQKCS